MMPVAFQPEWFNCGELAGCLRAFKLTTYCHCQWWPHWQLLGRHTNLNYYDRDVTRGQKRPEIRAFEDMVGSHYHGDGPPRG